MESSILWRSLRSLDKRFASSVILLDLSWESVGDLSNSLAGLSLTEGDSESDELLKAGIDLVMHGRVLRGNVAELLKVSQPLCCTLKSVEAILEQ